MYVLKWEEWIEGPSILDARFHTFIRMGRMIEEYVMERRRCVFLQLAGYDMI